MLRSLVKLATTGFKYYVGTQLATRTLVSKRALRQVVTGVVLLVASGGLGLVGLTLALLGLFLQLADLDQFVVAALLTAAVSFLVAIVVFIEGWRRFRV
jgi:hypothetical protein